MVREDSINFVLENIILTFEEVGVSWWHFSIFAFRQNVSNVSISDFIIETFPPDDNLTVPYRNIYKRNSKRYDHTVMTADKDYHRNWWRFRSTSWYMLSRSLSLVARRWLNFMLWFILLHNLNVTFLKVGEIADNHKKMMSQRTKPISEWSCLIKLIFSGILSFLAGYFHIGW